MGSSSKIGESKSQPHAVCIPFPAQGHINPMLKLAKLLHSKGFYITFVNTQYNHKRLLKSRGSEAMAGCGGLIVSNFNFDVIPDGLSPSSSSEIADATQDIPSLCHSTSKTCLQPFLELLHKLNANNSLVDNHVPPVSCIVADAGMAFSVRAAEEVGVPIALFWTVSACGVLGFMKLLDLLPPKDPSNDIPRKGYSESTVDWIPSKKIPLKALPISMIPTTTDPEDHIMLNYFIETFSEAQKASIIGIIINTFQSLESEVLSFLSTKFNPTLFPIGPLQLLGNDDELGRVGLNLWEEDEKCVQWLNCRDPNSVVYVSFGSITVLTKKQLVEFAWGLANSLKPFLWVIRPDLLNDGAAVLPPEFVSQIEGRGMLASWCPQEEVLKHPAVGGFLTHNGWNSTLESIGYGVPMISWPFFADQEMNSWYCCSEWGIGIELNKDVKRDEVEEVIRELMEGEKGKEMKKKAMEWKFKAQEAINPRGSSFQNMDNLIYQLSKSQI